jgi:hypothetical protein
MSWHRRFLALGLTVVLLVGVSCTSDSTLTGVSETQTQQPSPLLGDLDLLDDPGGTLGGAGDVIDGAVDGVGDVLDGILGGAGNPVGTPTGNPAGNPAGNPVEKPVGDAAEGLLGGLGKALGGTLGGAVSAAGDLTDLLTCSEQKYVVVQQTIGPNGGKIKVGEHTLEIPKGALTRNVKIKAEQMRGKTNSVRFSPELHFEKSARLTMSYKNCALVLLPKSIVYTTEKFKILEVLRSIDLFNKKRVTAPIDHFSRYAVAY